MSHDRVVGELLQVLVPGDALRAGLDTSKRAGLLASAVSVLLVPIDTVSHVVLTKRSSSVAHHKGQIAFPGGMYEASDSDLLYTALRETEEEIGIPGDTVSVLGALDAVVTPTGFHITPFVGVLERVPQTVPNPDEIESVFFAPLAALAATWAPSRPESHGMPCYMHDEHVIWGATARIIAQLLRLVLY